MFAILSLLSKISSFVLNLFKKREIIHEYQMELDLKAREKDVNFLIKEKDQSLLPTDKSGILARMRKDRIKRGVK